MSRVLPPEITDQIIDLLYDDPSSLKACSLTCRSWIVTAQCHIFYTVHMRNGPTLYLGRLLDGSPHLAQFVKVLEIEEGNGTTGNAKFVEEFIPSLAPRLINLEELRLIGLWFGEVIEPVRSIFMDNFKSIRRLVLFESGFKTFHDFTTFVVAHPYIEHLELRNSGWEIEAEAPNSPEHDVSPDASSHLRLRSVSLAYASSASRLIHWMMSYCPSLHLNSLEILSLTPEDAPAVMSLLRFLGPSLENLEIAMSIHNGAGDTEGIVSNMLSISPSTSLHRLCFGGLVLYGSDDDLTEYSRTWVPILLSQATSYSVDEIIFRVHYGGVEGIQMFDLKRVNEILTQSRFDGLERVVFWLWGGEDYAEAIPEIKRRMNGLEEKGLLFIE